MFTVGIDLGTTASVVSYMENGHPQVIKIDGNVTVPSVVNYGEENPIVGQQAVYKSADSFSVFSIKNFMGTDEKFCGHTPSEISGHILSYLKRQAELKIGQKIDAAVITVPAHFSNVQRTATKLAASLAGIKVLSLINEPTAAAIAFGLDSRKNGIFAVYDFGGGTFDFSILRLSDGIFQVLATGGDNHLGGNDIDAQILEYNLKENGINEISDSDKIKARLISKFLKENLREDNVAEKEIEINRHSYKFSLSKNLLEQFSSNLLKKTFDISAQVMEDAELAADDLSGIVLVGGMTKLNLVKNFVKEHFQTEIIDTVNPDEAVSLGAAIHANSITENNSSVFLIDVVPLTLGVETFGGLVDKIVLRNTPIPTVERREYTTYADNQTGMKFKVVQGESPLSDECNILANFELRGIPPMPAGRARIIVEFSVDVNGLLNVTAFEKTTGIKQVVTVEASNNLSFEEMSQDLENAYKKKSENEEKAHLISLRLEMYRLVKFWKTIISEIPTDAQTIASTKINSIENHLQNENFDINEVMKLRTETENIFSAFLDEIINNHLCGKKLSEVRK